MPLFDFECLNCKNIFEFKRSFGTKGNPACPKCRSKRTDKLISPPTIQFKGSGFYKTDAVKRTPDPTPPAPESKPKEPPKEAKKPKTS